uniref:Hematopoietic cell-specific Lyn substrate 1 n=1 Tax=Gadus morhua TaxID=8049 RepID=A0A8C5ADV9_GADMO
MWKSAAGHNVSAKASAEPDDWETDPDFENDVSEQEQRWGAKTIEGSGHSEHISVAKLREAVSMEHQRGREKEQAAAPQASYGYGGRFGVEKDRMDKGAMGHDFVAEVERHSSQTDAARGFGGKFGVQKDRMDKAALGFEHKEKVEQHASQKDHSKGFGGKYGVEKEKVDRSALGYDYKGETEKHQSQRDYAKGFGGKFGVDKDNVDKAAMGYDYKGETEKHQSQKDYSKGFGGRYGVQTDRVDKVSTLPSSASAGAGKLKSRFEDMAKASGEENKRRVEEERERRRAREEKEQQETRRRQQVTEHAEPPGTDYVPSFSGASLEDRSPNLLSCDIFHLLGGDGQRGGEGERGGEEARGGEGAEGAEGARGDSRQAAGNDDIAFEEDDIITHIEMVDEGWWRGQRGGRSGLFPAAYVQLVP